MAHSVTISQTVEVSSAILENTWMFLRNLKQNGHMIQQPCFCTRSKELKLVCGRKTTLWCPLQKTKMHKSRRNGERQHDTHNGILLTHSSRKSQLSFKTMWTAEEHAGRREVCQAQGTNAHFSYTWEQGGKQLLEAGGGGAVIKTGDVACLRDAVSGWRSEL